MFSNYILFYLALINAAGFCLMAIDKRRAAKAGWRIPESRLLGAAAIGGGIGVYAGMRLLRHKTLHRRFSWGVPAIMAVQVGVMGWLYWSGGAV